MTGTAVPENTHGYPIFYSCIENPAFLFARSATHIFGSSDTKMINITQGAGFESSILATLFPEKIYLL